MAESFFAVAIGIIAILLLPISIAIAILNTLFLKIHNVIGEILVVILLGVGVFYEGKWVNLIFTFGTQTLKFDGLAIIWGIIILEVAAIAYVIYYFVDPAVDN